MTRTEWLALAERCRTATGPDRGIDAAILHALGFVEFGTADDGGIHWAIPRSFSSFEGRPSASLDAINELLGETLPGWAIGNASYWPVTDIGPVARLELWETYPAGHRYPGAHNFGAGHIRVEGQAATEPLARCAAFCAAMAERAEA